jgi:hypothetical protein
MREGDSDLLAVLTRIPPRKQQDYPMSLKLAALKVDNRGNAVRKRSWRRLNAHFNRSLDPGHPTLANIASYRLEIVHNERRFDAFNIRENLKRHLLLNKPYTVVAASKGSAMRSVTKDIVDISSGKIANGRFTSMGAVHSSWYRS